MLRIVTRAASRGAALAVFVALLSFSCGSEEPPETAESAPGSLQFSVDEELLGPTQEFPTLGIEMNAPAEWEPQEAPETEENPVEIERLYAGPGPSYLVVGTVRSEAPAQETAEALAQDETDEVTQFTHNGISFHQVRRITEENVIFFLLFATPENGKELGMLQFTVPSDEIENRARLIESSLGSVSSLDR
ncbi:MAG: hypothetical protein ACLFPW_03505 [Spirochaetaceae bacterium]